MFGKKEKLIILNLAIMALKDAVLSRESIDKNRLLKQYPWLKQKGAVFVTVNKQNNLRGCIGSIVAYQSLLDDIIQNAKSAALNDPRFKPITPNELDALDIEVSLLTNPEPLAYSDIEDLKKKIKPNIDGVILNYRGNRATYLPSVWEQLPDFDIFFGSLCQKAGFASNCLHYHPQIFTYQAIKISKDTL